MRKISIAVILATVIIANRYVLKNKPYIISHCFTKNHTYFYNKTSSNAQTSLSLSSYVAQVDSPANPIVLHKVENSLLKAWDGFP